MSEKNLHYIEASLICLLAILITSIVILSMVPPVSKDALVHHLAVPKLYLKHGGIYEIPFMGFSYYPMNLDLLYMIPLYFGNDIAPKFMHFVFALLTAWLIFEYIKHRANSIYGLLGAVFFLSIPIIIKLSITVYVDLGEIFFSFASLLLLLKWIKSGFRLRFIIFSGLFCGLALGTKYSGLVTLILLTLFVPFLYARYNRGGRSNFSIPIMYGIIFFLISLFIFSPWMIRNYYWKSNPIYPLHNKLFNPPQSLPKSSLLKGAVIKKNSGFFTFRSMIYHETGWQIALLPIRIFFQGKDGSSQYFDGKLNPFLLFLPLLAFMRFKKDHEYLRAEKKIMLIFSLLFFCFAFFSFTLRIRYIAPIIPPLVILSVFGIKNLFESFQHSSSRINRQVGISIVVMIVVFMILFNANYLIGQFRYVGPFRYLNGSLSRDGYIARYRPEYPAMEYINKNLDPEAKVLFIFLGKRGYYCDREYIFDMGMLKRLIERSNSPQELLQGLRKQGITHLLTYYRLLEKWMENNFSSEKIMLIRGFLTDHVRFLFYEKGFGVSILKNSSK